MAELHPARTFYTEGRALLGVGSALVLGVLRQKNEYGRIHPAAPFSLSECDGAKPGSRRAVRHICGSCFRDRSYPCLRTGILEWRNEVDTSIRVYPKITRTPGPT